MKTISAVITIAAALAIFLTSQVATHVSPQEVFDAFLTIFGVCALAPLTVIAFADLIRNR